MERTAFLDEVREKGDEYAVAVAERIFGWADVHGMRDTWNPPSAHGYGYLSVMKNIEWEATPFGVFTMPPRVFIQGDPLRNHHPFKIEARWTQALDRIHAVPGVVPTELGFYPHILLDTLGDEGSWVPFFDAIEWMMQQLTRSAERGIR